MDPSDADIQGLLLALAQDPTNRAARRIVADAYRERDCAIAGWYHDYLASLPEASCGQVAGFLREGCQVLEASPFWLGLNAENQRMIRGRVGTRFSVEEDVVCLLVGGVPRRQLDLCEDPTAPLLYCNLQRPRWQRVRPRKATASYSCLLAQQAASGQETEPVGHGRTFGETAEPYFVVDEE